MTTWIEDAAGNKCSVEYWGTNEAAQAALNSLKNCRLCVNCSGCSGCSDCSGCSGCSGCSDCSDCSDCSGCSGCSDCSDCSGCSGCSGCSRCSDLRNATPTEPTESKFTAPPIPVIVDIHKKVYAAVSQPDALDMATWHTCDTTHCRGGWVIALAGEAGKALERFHDTGLAAQLIYRESGYPINPARFYDSDDAAMEDMRRLAEIA